MKRFLLSLIIALALAIPAFADGGLVDFGATNSVPAISTNTTPANSAGIGGVVKIDDSDSIGIQVRAQGNNADGSPITVRLARSADNTTWETTPYLAIYVPTSGTTATVLYTNIGSAVGGANYLRIYSIVNPSTNAAMTNFLIGVCKKRTKPGT